MKNFTTTIGILSLVLLTACSNNSAPTAAEKDMAEMMGITVEEMRNQTPEEHMKMMQKMNENENADHHQGETDVKPHDDSMNQMMDDHHAGETDVEPHGHDEENSMQKMMDDHHEGEDNVEPHDHEDADANLPPSRSRLEGTNDDHHEDEENVEPHGH